MDIIITEIIVNKKFTMEWNLYKLDKAKKGACLYAVEKRSGS